MRLGVLSAASRARRHASSITARQLKIIREPETLSAYQKLSTSASLPVAMTAEIEHGGDACRTTAKLVVDNDAREVAPLVTTPSQPIRSQSDGSSHVDNVSLAESVPAMPSLECVYYSKTDGAVTLSNFN